MKTFDYEKYIKSMLEARTISSTPMPECDSIVFNRAILEGLVHISKQIEELRKMQAQWGGHDN